MWTHDRLKVDNWRGDRVPYKQHKLNGHRLTVWKQKNGKLVAFERKIRPDLEMTVKRPKIVEYDWWKALKQIPPMSSVDGEAYVQFGNAGDAAHAIAECLPALEFMPFAVPWWNNSFYPYASLKTTSEGLKKAIGLKLAPFFSLLEDDDEELLLSDAVNLGIEGWVLKEANYYGWWKVKPTKTVDAIVTGFKDGRGKYLGAVGSLLVSIYYFDRYTGKDKPISECELIEVARVSGMDDVTRWDIDEDKDLGRVCEVEYQEVGNGRRLIHPRFVRWRDDKPEDQCVYKWEDL